MNGGTYSEALKVGFHPEAAGFLARMSAESKSEAAELVERILESRERPWRKLVERIMHPTLVEIAILALTGLMGYAMGRL